MTISEMNSLICIGAGQYRDRLDETQVNFGVLIREKNTLPPGTTTPNQNMTPVVARR